MILQLDRETTQKHYGNKMKLRGCRKVLLSSKSLRRGVRRQSLFIVNLVPLLWGGWRDILNFSNLRREERSHVFFVFSERIIKFSV